MYKNLWFVGGLMVLATMAAGQNENGKITLKSRYAPGTYVMTLQLDSNSTSTLPNGQVVDEKHTMTTVWEMEVGNQDANGLTTARMTFKRVAVTNQSKGMIMTYDSAYLQDSNPLMAKVYAPMIGQAVVVTLDANNKVISVSGMDEIADAMAAANLQMTQTSQNFQNLKKTFSNDSLAEAMNWASEVMPSQPVAVGERWETSHSQSPPTLGEIEIKEKCTLKEIKSTPAGKVAVIAFTFNAEKSQGKSTTTNTGMEMTFNNIKIHQDGTMEMLLDSGMPLSSLADQKISMGVSIKPQQPSEGTTQPVGMNGAIQRDNTIKITVQKGKYSPPATASPEQPPTTGQPSTDESSPEGAF
ncbi:MAG: DUF6263 family protein [Phycisphaerae bacterium]|jgi:hypothetical protein